MRLTLIGHSGTGKSHWARALEAEGFRRFCCDSMIEARLGLADIRDVARWMGQPYVPHYRQRSRQYLALEQEAVREVVQSLAQTPRDAGPIVVDSTGSLIYLEEGLLRELAARTTIVYLETPPSVVAEMYELYLRDPKPVIWGDSFTIEPGDSPLDALRRCYPTLLRDRAARYAAYSHTRVSYETVRRDGFTVRDLLDHVNRAVPQGGR